MARQIIHKDYGMGKTACGLKIKKSTNIANWNRNVTCKKCQARIAQYGR